MAVNRFLYALHAGLNLLLAFPKQADDPTDHGNESDDGEHQNDAERPQRAVQ